MSRIVEAGDAAIALEFDARIDPRVNARAVWAGTIIRAANIPGVRDVVSTYHTVTVYFDPVRADIGRVQALLANIGSQEPDLTEENREPYLVPVCYGGEYGPDLEAVASFAGCTAQGALELHAARVYRVYMLGFVPGFTYMGTVDDRIAAPRRPVPRARVPAGSVGIAGRQTGIYPSETPGGWQIVGRTPLRPFDPDRAEAFLFEPGDRVRFQPIRPEQFREMEDPARDGAEPRR